MADTGALGHIAEDGSVTFPAARPSVTIELPSASRLGREIGRDLTDWVKDPYAYVRAHPGGTEGTVRKPAQAGVPGDGSIGLAPPVHGGGPDGYSDTELLELNRGRHAAAPFQP